MLRLSTHCCRTVLPRLLVALIATSPFSAHAAPPAPLSADQRAHDLVARLTTEEKIAQLRDITPAIPRLGIAAYNWWSEGLHGMARNGYATVFPQAIGLAASWDTGLMMAVGDTVASEARARYHATPAAEGHPRYDGLTIWSPNVNIFRDPRWGRGQETYGEDPYLTGQLAVAFIHGLQGDDPLHPKVIATPKHFAVHSGPEPLRHAFNVEPTPYDLEATYLPAFRAAIVDGQAQSIMCAYNAIDGIPACANTALLRQRLRTDWQFRGFVVSDCDAVDDMTAFHHYSKDDAVASAEAIKAGTDLNCGPAYKELARSLQRGLVAPGALDVALERLFAARFRLGQFDAPSTPLTSASDDNDPAHQALALRAANESMILLKNREHMLPLKQDINIAVIGPTADLLEDLEANYHGTSRHPVTPLAGMREHFGAARIRYAQGSALATGISVVIPDTALRTPDGKPGLRGEYFDNLQFQGKPAQVRDDATVQLDVDHIAPVTGLSTAGYAIRWTGKLVVPAAGDYALGAKIDRCFDCAGHDRVRLYLDGHLLRDGLVDTDDATVHMTRAGEHDLRLEWMHTGEDQGITLQWRAPAQAQQQEALAAATAADVVVAFVGLSPDLEGEELKVDVPGFAGGDRTTLDLPAPQQQLLTALQATGKPLVLVLQSGSAVALNGAAEKADAVLAAWYPGQAGGTAIAQTLAGDNNPAGRLPVTVYRSASDLPPFADYRMQGRTYRYFKGRPLYAFGSGLSYSRFDYSDLALAKATLAAGQPLSFDVSVHNSSDRDGDEVLEAYLQAAASPTAPLRSLAAFQRVHLRSGERRVVHFVVSPRSLSTVDAQGNREVVAGRYLLHVGGQQPGEGPTLQAAFDIEGQLPLPR